MSISRPLSRNLSDLQAHGNSGDEIQMRQHNEIYAIIWFAPLVISTVLSCVHETRPNNKSSLKWFAFVCGDFFSIWELVQNCLLMKRRHSKLLSFITICHFLPRIKSCHVRWVRCIFVWQTQMYAVLSYFRSYCYYLFYISENFKSVNVHDFLCFAYFSFCFVFILHTFHLSPAHLLLFLLGFCVHRRFFLKMCEWLLFKCFVYNQFVSFLFFFCHCFERNILCLRVSHKFTWANTCTMNILPECLYDVMGSTSHLFSDRMHDEFWLGQTQIPQNRFSLGWAFINRIFNRRLWTVYSKWGRCESGSV